MLIIRSCYFIRKGVKLYMGWTTNYSGPQIDETLEKGRDLKVVNNGWINLESSQSSPTYLGNLKNPGNYITFYWTDGPTLNETIPLLNITVVLINDVLHQFVNALGYTYSRVMNSDNTFSNWSIDQTYGILKPGATAPTHLVAGKTLWLDTTIVTAPTLKLYTSDGWKEVIPTSAMQSTIYDPQGKKRDIFKYIEDSIAAILANDESVTFENHINTLDIHVTANEKNRWDTAPTHDSLNTRDAEIKSDIDNYIIESFGTDISKFEELDEAITETDGRYDHHVENTIIHPDSLKRSEWDNKSDSNHDHHQDGRVTVDPAHVNGVIPTNQLPHDVKERVYVVNSIEEMYAYTKNPVHNGDFFCVENADGMLWYAVIDDTYLGKTTQIDGVIEASKAFKQIIVSIEAEWANVKNAPNTVAGYGITDAATQADLAEVNNRINTIQGNLSEEDRSNIRSITNAEATRNNILNMISSDPFTLLDTIIDTLNSVSE